MQLPDGIKLFQRPAKICAVYFLFKNGVIIYVGQSINLCARLISHPIQDWDEARYLECEPEKLDEIEKHWIIELKPRFNKTYKDQRILRKLKPKKPLKVKLPIAPVAKLMQISAERQQKIEEIKQAEERETNKLLSEMELTQKEIDFLQAKMQV